MHHNTVQGKKKVGDIPRQSKRPLVEMSDQMLGSLQFRTVRHTVYYANDRKDVQYIYIIAI